LVNNGCQQLQPLPFVTVNFAPTGTTPPNASLQIMGSNQAYSNESFPLENARIGTWPSSTLCMFGFPMPT
jgi:hypothetical protein